MPSITRPAILAILWMCWPGVACAQESSEPNPIPNEFRIRSSARRDRSPSDPLPMHVNGRVVIDDGQGQGDFGEIVNQLSAGRPPLHRSWTNWHNQGRLRFR